MPLNAQRVKASLNRKAAMHLLLRVAIALEDNESQKCNKACNVQIPASL
jgi:hypothetical protein